MEHCDKDHIRSARQLAAAGLLTNSFNSYLMGFEATSDTKVPCELEFQSVLSKLNQALSINGKIEEMFQNLEIASKTYPHNVHILNETGKYLYKYGFYLESWNHFQRALTLDPGYVNAERNLNSVKNLLVERWHFRMLNDNIRNEAYRKALANIVQPRDSVIDIGTGTGLLAMFASDHSLESVTACDGSETMCNLAKSIIKFNDKQNVHIFNEMSTSLTSQDIGGVKSIVVTELFDAGLFGEHVLPALHHAWENLLTKHHGQVIPNRAEFFIIGVKCDSLNMKYQLCNSAKEVLCIPNLSVHTLAHEETYDCDDVYLCKDLKYITEPQKLLDVDFNNIKDIQDKMVCSHPFSVNLTCIEDGQINVYIGWFNLHLTDNIVLTTNPISEKRANAWQQAVFFDNIPQIVTKGQIVNASFIINHDRITMSCIHNGQVIRTSSDIIRYLNDSDLMNIVDIIVPLICNCYNELGDIKEMDIVDLSPFPLFGLYLLKKGSRSLVCCAKNETDKLFIEQVFQANNIPISKVTILLGDECDYEYFTEEYHSIICDTLETSGDINATRKTLAQHLKLNNLRKGGLFIPYKVTLMGQLIHCDWLDLNNRVYDKNIPGYKVAQHVNQYQVSQNICLDYSRLNFKPLSDIQELADCMSEMYSEVIDVPVLNCGDCNAILCWYKVELFKNHIISTNRANSYVNSMAFLAHPKVTVRTGDVGNILLCVDLDGNFKLVIDVD